MRFDIPGDELEIYVDEVSLGIVDLSTFAGGMYTFVGMVNPNAAVSVGGSDNITNGRLWTDNFQIGQVVPEPSSLLLVGMSLVGLLGHNRRRK